MKTYNTPFPIILLLHRINTGNKNQRWSDGGSKTSDYFEKILKYIFKDFAPENFKCICELDKKKKRWACYFIFSLFLGKTVLNNTFAEFWFRWV